MQAPSLNKTGAKPKSRTMKTTEALPKIIAIVGIEDHGPCDPEPTASCPHCGADGRYIYHFICEDGSHRGAMAGCLKLFPKHQFAEKVQGVFKKSLEARKSGRRLASWDEDVLKATEMLESGAIQQREWEARLSGAFYRRAAYLKNRYGR
jgi:hypothetical protein